ncbi:hypothetical protein TNIN_223351, partial [Trichonephila inaurata madagascariensis]
MAIAYGRRCTYSNLEIRRRYTESEIQRCPQRIKTPEIKMYNEVEKLLLKSSVILLIAFIAALIMRNSFSIAHPRIELKKMRQTSAINDIVSFPVQQNVSPITECRLQRYLQ